MIHAHYFITRKADISEAEFHRYWRETHGPIARKIPQLRRYVQSHRIAAPNSNSSFDGEAEVWLDGIDALAALRRSAEYLNGALADEPNFINMARVEWMVTEDHPIVDGPSGGNLIKGIWQLKRMAGMTLKDFRRYWIEVHGALGAKVPGVRRYIQTHLIDEAYSYTEPRFDGVAQLWFDSVEAMTAAFATREGKELLADGPKFIDSPGMRFFAAQENVVIESR